MRTNITLRQIRYFVSAAETGSISAAALVVGISQSAITEAIRSLEIEIGSPLFLRHAKGVALTRAGQHFHRNARGVLDGIAAIRSGMGDADGLPPGRLRIGVTPMVSGYMIADLLARYRRLHPGVELDVEEGHRSEIERRLARAELDLAVLATSPFEPAAPLECQPLRRSDWRVWVAPTHPFAEQESVTLREVAGETLIAATMDEIGSVTDRIWREAGLQPRFAMRTLSFEAVGSLVGTGSGVALMPDLVYRGWSLEGERIVARRLRDRLPPLEFGVVWRREACGEALGSFREVARLAA